MNRVWTDLRLWINEQETIGLTTGLPPALTAAQRNAIDVLVPGAMPGPLVSAPMPAPGPSPSPAPDGRPVVDPEFDQGLDWVSQLFQYTQKKGQPAEFESEMCELGPKAPVKWVVYCSVTCEGGAEIFPNKVYGFLNGKPPCFSNKKHAKHYASMCAMHHINNLIPAPSPAKQPAGPSARGCNGDISGARLATPPVDHEEPLAPTYYSDSEPAASGPARKKARADSGDAPEAWQQVLQLCKRLGMPTLRIIVTPHDNPNFFDAQPVFPDSFPAAVPPHLGAVTGIYTKKAAKEAAAELVLEWLKGVESERNGIFDGLAGRRLTSQ